MKDIGNKAAGMTVEGQHTQCPLCLGEGIVISIQPAEGSTETCPHCKGTGVEPEKSK